ncbi:hypothetical protein [Nocardiopsis lambiniae]|uniref:Uncharacterized protein n=1 Tax=Nocardiopsis lambiniae TaxID=3075539 RepID=A0ABU2MDM0_9ACTN|nr:hypothetical protein [Nocardiopsis sp. DSM 44743]MDT0330021.1 hypothetical protein [Nocardiopsis sp. DSM 44743]
MAEPVSGTVKNTLVNWGQILKMVQIGNLHGHLAIYLGDMGRLTTEEVRNEYQQYLEATFVPADQENFDRFQKYFSEDGKRLAVLVGEPGSGRETAAIALHSSIGLSVHSISLSEALGSPVKVSESQNEAPDILLSRTHPLSGVGYLVDVSGLRRIDDKTLGELSALASRVVAEKAALTIVARPGQLDGELIHVPVLHVRRPAGIDVLARHLGHLFGAAIRNAWVSWNSVTELMRTASPADAARLARIAFQIKNSGYDGGGFDTWIRTSIDAYGDWASDIRGWFEEHRGGDAEVWSRVVLITTAFLEGNSADDVLGSADLLAHELKIGPGDAGGLTGLGVDPTLELVGAHRAPDGLVRFRKPDYASAVLVYLWEQHPRLRESLRSWTDSLITEVSSKPATTLRSTWTRLALLRRDQALTVDLFNRWSREGKTRLSAAVFAAEIASSPDFGSAMRARLYDAARSPVSEHQAVAVAYACALYGEVNPASALVRLKWLAEADSDRVRRAVLRALEDLAGNDERWFDVVDALLQEWCGVGTSDGRRSVAHRFAVRSLAASDHGVPLLLTRMNTYTGLDRQGMGDYIADLWGALLDTEDEEIALQAVGTWVSCTLEDETRFDDIEELFIRAVVGGGEAEVTGEKVKGRILTAMRMINQWCTGNGVDPRVNTVYTLQARLLASHVPGGASST